VAEEGGVSISLYSKDNARCEICAECMETIVCRDVDDIPPAPGFGGCFFRDQPSNALLPRKAPKY
jgi:hypothetical protein